ncbi:MULTISPECIES: YbaN family protein [unclassified Colwellia]|uniref:YbaN family protein n=1 Tax=unclassified Colwellia TaxID=196834 RepID=UPI0015F4DD47|nr:MULTISPECIES: YbaN family protein [unclassified Colwellia]MBA6381189.1 YbaN family protein [Colwellia sp. BRX10-7]MBA6388860.1 YbaN family protein [Colwellia sp. BRX10-2]MBA6403678.1 YbaN family protein [Colwellia sp. BRX10-5]MBA6407380.1 YbaN family protein [Colwellia sp. BRX10-1]
MNELLAQRLLKLTGLFFVGLALLGVVLPILPTTPFLLVAASCFAKSSPRMNKRLLRHKVFGPLIYHWQTSGSIPKRAKTIALSTIILATMGSCYQLDNNLLRVLVIVLVAGPFIFLWRLPLSAEEQKT